jgi:glutaminyl-peptide cyclotransferase
MVAALAAVGRAREPERLRVEVLASRPHDPRAFTQGLLFADGALFESTGLEGRSSLRQVDPASGEVVRSVDVPAPLFAEGIALAGGRIFQLTWRDGEARVYDPSSLRLIARHSYTGEGWGLAFDGRRLVMSDGTSTLWFRDPESFDVVSSVTVTLRGAPLAGLNELEHAGGAVYANVWRTDRIVRIDPASGEVTAEIDASGLLTAEERVGADVLNGIAHDPARGVFYLTGKLWPRMFEVRFVPAP